MTRKVWVQMQVCGAPKPTFLVSGPQRGSKGGAKAAGLDMVIGAWEENSKNVIYILKSHFKPSIFVHFYCIHNI